MTAVLVWVLMAIGVASLLAGVLGVLVARRRL